MRRQLVKVPALLLAFAMTAGCISDSALPAAAETQLKGASSPEDPDSGTIVLAAWDFTDGTDG